MVEAPEQLLEDRADLHPGEVGAEAEVPPEAEREVARRVLPTHVEAHRVGEDLVVAVGGRERQVQQVAGLERHVAERERLLAVAHEVLHRRDVADDLVGELAVDQLGLRLQQLELVRVLARGRAGRRRSRSTSCRARRWR